MIFIQSTDTSLHLSSYLSIYQPLMLFTSIYPQTSSAFDLSARNPKESAAIKFPSDIQAVISSKRPNYGHLYIGNIESAQNSPLLSSLGIGCILSVAKERLPLYPKQQIRYHKHVPIKDDQNADIHPYVHECVAFIAEKLLFTNALIHCINGVNRSACFVIAYLMKQQKMDLDHAVKEVKSKRRLVQLSRPMFEQLRKYENDLMNLASSKRRYSHSIRVDSQADISSISPSYFKQNTENDGSLLAELYAQEDRVVEKETSKIERMSSAGKSSRKYSLSKEETWKADSNNPEKALKANELNDSKSDLTSKRSNSRQESHKTPSKIQKRCKQLSNLLLQVQQKQEKEQNASRITFRRPSQRYFQPEQLEGGAIQPNFFTGLLE